jgi:hypothetical protein
MGASLLVVKGAVNVGEGTEGAGQGHGRGADCATPDSAAPTLEVLGRRSQRKLRSLMASPEEVALGAWTVRSHNRTVVRAGCVLLGGVAPNQS